MEVVAKRKGIRLPRQDYLGTRWYFVTACCHGRRPHFRNAQLAEFLIAALRESAASRAFRIHAYCVMPDHVHFLAAGTSAESDLVSLMTLFKQKAAHGAASRFRIRQLWQRYFYDHVLRKGEDADAVAWYIWLNPVRKRMAVQPSEYPFLGSFVAGVGPVKQPTEWWIPPWKKSAM